MLNSTGGGRGRPGDRRRGLQAWNAGRWAETLAAWRLRCAGYQILARNWRSPVGEIDIVARRGTILVIVEVKRRGELATALQAIAPRQQARLVRAALAFQARRQDTAGLTLRFDVIALGRPGFWPRHIREAWRPASD
ncbi:MAG TPA: YraN family protein [Dongiaceae bacterium]